MSNKHKRALFITVIVGAICAAPIYYLWKLNNLDRETLMSDLGSVPEFAYATSDGQSSFTHYDTFKRVTLLTLVNSGCQSSCLSDTLSALKSLKEWADAHLVNKNKNDSKPQEINFVVMTRTPAMETLAAGIKHVFLEPTEDFFIPGENADDQSLFVIISQEGRFKAVLPALAKDTPQKSQRLLAKLTSDNYLLHYLTLQNLMWEKAKDYSRGKIR